MRNGPAFITAMCISLVITGTICYTSYGEYSVRRFLAQDKFITVYANDLATNSNRSFPFCKQTDKLNACVFLQEQYRVTVTVDTGIGPQTIYDHTDGFMDINLTIPSDTSNAPVYRALSELQYMLRAQGGKTPDERNAEKSRAIKEALK